MLIKALCDYYDCTVKSSIEMLPEYLSEQNVHYMILLSEDGDMEKILDIRKKTEIALKGGKTKETLVPVTAKLPKRTQKPAVDLNIVEHRPLYIFGLNYEGGKFTSEDKTQKAKKSHACFVAGNLEFCSDLTSPLAKAYCRFIEKWNPEEQCENPQLLMLAKDYSAGYYCFGLSGHPEAPLHEDKELLQKYEAYFLEKTGVAADTADCLICPVEGKKLPTARIHDKISGFKGGNATGSVLIGMKESAFESYGKTQSFNSGVSEIAMRKYTAALNKLISNKKHRIFIGDMTIIFFGISENDEDEAEFLMLMAEGDPTGGINASLKSIASEILGGRAGGVDNDLINHNMMFYVAGLAPNSARISQKFIYRNKFGKIIENLLQHQRDMNVDDSGRQVYLSVINKELISPKSTDEKVPPPLIAAIFKAAFEGTRYPAALLSTVIRRVKTDSDEEKNKYIKINQTRIGIIKACINRKARLLGNKEEITMALNIEEKNPAYLCGRLFAVLEFVQQRASGGALNKTIKDSFFSSACSRPAVVFPRLLKLAQNHIGKIEGGYYFNSRIGEIVEGLESQFPQTLSLDDQGKFIIGYYHQNKDLYTSRASKEKADGESGEEPDEE